MYTGRLRMKQMFHGKCTFSQSQTPDFLKFSAEDSLLVLPKFLQSILRVSLGLVSYHTENFLQSVEYCMAASSTTC